MTAVAAEWDHVEAHSIAQLERLRAPWLQLTGSCWAPNIDLDRFAAVTPFLNAAPYVALWSAGGSPRCMIAGRAFTRRHSIRLGYRTVALWNIRELQIVYRGAVTDGTQGAATKLAEHIRKLADSGEYDLITCSHLPADDCLARALTARGGYCHQREPHWRLLLDTSLDATLAKHSSKHRSNLRRLDRKLAETLGDTRIVTYEQPEQVDEFILHASGIAARSYQGGIGAGVRSTGLFKAMYHQDAIAGRFCSFILWSGAVPVAYQAGLIQEHVYFGESTAFVPEYEHLRPGTVLFMRVLQELCNRSVSVFDFGFGDAEYKRTYGTHQVDEVTLVVAGRSLRGRGVRALEQGRASLRATLTQWLQQSQLKRVKRAWRRRLSKQSDR